MPHGGSETRLVIYYQDTFMPSGQGMVRSASKDARAFGCGKQHLEGRPFTRFALDFNDPSVALHDAVNDRKPQSRPHPWLPWL